MAEDVVLRIRGEVDDLNAKLQTILGKLHDLDRAVDSLGDGSTDDLERDLGAIEQEIREIGAGVARTGQEFDKTAAKAKSVGDAAAAGAKRAEAAEAQRAAEQNQNLRQAEDLAQKLEQRLGLRAAKPSIAETRAELQKLRNTIDSGTEQARQLDQRLAQIDRHDTPFRRLRDRVGGVTEGFRLLKVAALGFFAIRMAQLVTRQIQVFLDYKASLDGATRALTAATGSHEQAGREMAWVRDKAEELGVEFLALTDGYAKMSFAAKDAGISQEQNRHIVTQVATAAKVLNLTMAEQEGIFVALEQMVSKGAISMEELRRQLGNRLPGAFQIAAQGMGITTEELEKLIRTGQLAAKDFLPQFADAIQKAYGPQAQEAAQDLAAEINRTKLALIELNQVAVNAAETGLKEGLRDFQEDLKDIQPLAAGAGVAIGGLIGNLDKAALALGLLFPPLLSVKSGLQDLGEEALETAEAIRSLEDSREAVKELNKARQAALDLTDAEVELADALGLLATQNDDVRKATAAYGARLARQRGIAKEAEEAYRALEEALDGLEGKMRASAEEQRTAFQNLDQGILLQVVAAAEEAAAKRTEIGENLFAQTVKIEQITTSRVIEEIEKRKKAAESKAASDIEGLRDLGAAEVEAAQETASKLEEIDRKLTEKRSEIMLEWAAKEAEIRADSEKGEEELAEARAKAEEKLAEALRQANEGRKNLLDETLSATKEALDEEVQIRAEAADEINKKREEAEEKAAEITRKGMEKRLEMLAEEVERNREAADEIAAIRAEGEAEALKKFAPDPSAVNEDVEKLRKEIKALEDQPILDADEVSRLDDLKVELANAQHATVGFGESAADADAAMAAMGQQSDMLLGKLRGMARQAASAGADVSGITDAFEDLGSRASITQQDFSEFANELEGDLRLAEIRAAQEADNLGKSVEGAGQAATKTGEDFKAAAGDMVEWDEETKTLRNSTKGLADETERSGDETKKLGETQKEAVTEGEKLRKELEEIADSMVRAAVATREFKTDLAEALEICMRLKECLASS